MRNTDLLPTTGIESLHLANIYSAQCEVLRTKITKILAEISQPLARSCEDAFQMTHCIR